MAYLKRSDWEVVITAEDLAQLIHDSRIDGPNDQLLLDAEMRALRMAEGYLNPRFDVQAILWKPQYNDAYQTNETVKGYIIDIALYELYKRVVPYNIAPGRQKAYDDAMRWLKDIHRGVIALDLPLRIEGATGVAATPYATQSNEKKNYDVY